MKLLRGLGFIAAFAVAPVFAGAAPVLGGLGGSLNFTENDPATLLVPTATVTDADSVNFDTGSLTVNFTAGGTAGDELSVRNVGTGAGQIGVANNTISFGGTAIAVFSGGNGTAPLLCIFNVNATPAAAQELLRNLRFGNNSNNPTAGSRTVTVVLNDGSGASSTPGMVTVDVTAVNDPPVALTAGLTMLEDTPITTALPVLDFDSTAFTFTIVTQPAKGSVEITNPVTGAFRFTPALNQTGPDSFTYKASDGFAESDLATISVNISALNDPPVIQSAPAATPNPARPGDTIAFSVVAADIEDSGVIPMWTFGDGTTATGGNVSKTFAAPGIYSASVTITDSLGLVVTGAVTVRISVLDAIGSAPSVSDLDGDGFSDALEAAAGTAANDPLQTPTGSAAGSPLPLAGVKLSIKLNFAAVKKDRIALSGTLLVPDEYNATDQHALVDVGGATRDFLLNPSAAGTTADSSFKVALKKNNFAATAAKFTAKLGGDFAAALAAHGLVNASTKTTVSVPVSLVFAGRLYTASLRQAYTARAGKGGSTR